MLKEKTLLDAFVPPNDYICEFCIATSMSQDTTALEQIIETLTGKKTSELKTIYRDIRFVLINDNSSAVVEANRLGAIYPIRLKDKNRLLHAKMALIKFISNDDVIYRLVVSTGNYTTASLNQQIEMVWTQDYESGNIEGGDLKNAGEFLQKLVNDFCYIEAGFKEKLNLFLEEIISLKASEGTSAFIHSIEESLYSQFLQKIQHFKKGKNKHDYIFFGTPFFQENLGRGNFVLDTIIENMNKEGVIIWRKTDCFLQTNEHNFTKGLNKACEENEINIHGIRDTKRSLHSKFIYIAYQKDNSLKDGILYMGSGNLTMNGFMKPQNIECAVVLGRQEIVKKKDFLKSFHIGESIREDDFRDEEIGIKEDSKKESINLSVNSARLIDNKLMLTLCEKEDFLPFKVIVKGIILTEVIEHSNYPVEVELTDRRVINDIIFIEDSLKNKYSVLVLDSEGKSQKTEAIHRDFDEILGLLKSFPNIYLNEDENDESFVPEDVALAQQISTDEERVNHHKNFSLYNLSQLIEHISRENEKISKDQLNDWANTLRYSLMESLKTEEKKRMAKLGLDKISTLKLEGFRPSLPLEFQENYIEAINSIISDWEVSLGTP